MESIDVYFDYASPFAYLATEVLPAVAERAGVDAIWKPIDLMGLSNYANGLPYSDVKRRYVAIDAARSAEFHGVPIRVPKPHPIESGRALRLAAIALDDARFPVLHGALFRAAWREQRDLSEEGVLRDCVAEAEAPADDWLARSEEPEARERLRLLTSEAESRGVFGVPSMLVGDEVFWGLDSLPALEWRLGRQARATG